MYLGHILFLRLSGICGVPFVSVVLYPVLWVGSESRSENNEANRTLQDPGSMKGFYSSIWENQMHPPRRSEHGLQELAFKICVPSSCLVTLY